MSAYDNSGIKEWKQVWDSRFDTCEIFVRQTIFDDEPFGMRNNSLKFYNSHGTKFGMIWIFINSNNGYMKRL